MTTPSKSEILAYLSRLAQFRALKALQAPERAELEERRAILDQALRRASYFSQAQNFLLDPWITPAGPKLVHGWETVLVPAEQNSLMKYPAVCLWIDGDEWETAMWGVSIHDPWRWEETSINTLGRVAVLPIAAARDAVEEKARAAGWAPLLRGENLGPALSALPEDYGLEVEGEQPPTGNKVCWLKLRSGAGFTGGRRAWLEEQETSVTLHMDYADRPQLRVSLPVYDLPSALEGAATFLRGRP